MKKQIDKAIEESNKTGKKLGDVLVEQKMVNSDQLRQLFSYILGIPFVNIEKEIIPKEISSDNSRTDCQEI